MRLKLVPDTLKFDFFKWGKTYFGISVVLNILTLVAFLTLGLNYGIDFKGGTTIRSEAAVAVDVGQYRAALDGLGLGEVSITEVYDPAFRADQHVAQIRIEGAKDQVEIAPEMVARVEAALVAVEPSVKFTAVESVGPKVSGELIWTAVEAVALALLGIMFYVWLRFEWQFSIGALVSLFHDVALTIGLFCILGLKFDLSIIAALLTIIGYSINDTVIVFDRIRENLRKYKTMPLADLMNLSINDTMSRTLMTSGTTLISLIALLIFGGDVIRGFVFAMTWGIVVGTYSSIFIASQTVLFFGVKRDWSRVVADDTPGTQFTTSPKA